MPLKDEHEEERVQIALRLLYENPKLKIIKAVRTVRVSYKHVRHQIKGILRSSSQGGYIRSLILLLH